MKNALLDWVVPFLVQSGFHGKFPNYRRHVGDCVDIVTFQFTAFDHAFCVNLAKCPSDGIRYTTGEIVPAELATALHCPTRFCLGTANEQRYHWFKYEPKPQEFETRNQFPFLTMYADTPFKYKHIADDIIMFLRDQGERWWNESEEWWTGSAPAYNRLFLKIQSGITREMWRAKGNH